MDDALSLPFVTLPGAGGSAPADADDAADLTDEEAARRAREQYREHGVPSMAADTTVADHLQPGEQVLAVRAQAGVGRIDEATHAAIHDDGPLYVTSERLLHLGQSVTSVPLADIAELAMADDRLLVTIAGGRGLMLDVAEPRQLRVLVAAARSAVRG